MTEIFISADNIVSPIGLTAAENFSQLKQHVSGIQLHQISSMSQQPFQAALFADGRFNENDQQKKYTKFENLLITSISDALSKSNIEPADKKTVLIISSTKGNISLLETEEASGSLNKRISLNTSAKLVADHFQFINQPVIISNACISGMLAMLTGMRLIQSGQYEHAVVAGADVISKFVLSGFQSFQAVSQLPCKPFDAARDGINLGEGAGTVILTSNKKYSYGVKIGGGSVSNDANHISGPSRTGEELSLAINKTLQASGIFAKDIGFISAHGTATIFNDEMEAKAIGLSGLQEVPVNSLKGYYGHTLGAAGLIESIISIQSLKENLVLPTRGFHTSGVSQPVNICSSVYKSTGAHFLKTASGFGGCNAAMVFSKQ
ncbi:MAG: beta-ketoacyl synthase [Chitinophagaceae bacterium]|nr:beta-ketoacyl synthase [Chitinophagaceae bacterium]MBK8785615.1 beta-ketoacyl synthase [Chitinophagaceae bacterium]MBL0199490.1 beta-ketoacyl synthase [Chitinophagaceae bacterium]